MLPYGTYVTCMPPCPSPPPPIRGEAVTWTKTSDDFADDCDILSDAAYRAHHEGLTWSNRKLLDCRLPKDRLSKFITRPEAARELVDVGFWADDGDAYIIRHHATYQRTREQVIAQQERNRVNGKKHVSAKAPREVWTDGTQVGSQMGSPVANPQGQDRSGQGQALEEKVDQAIQEVIDTDGRGWTVNASAVPSQGNGAGTYSR